MLGFYHQRVEYQTNNEAKLAKECMVTDEKLTDVKTIATWHNTFTVAAQALS